MADEVKKKKPKTRKFVVRKGCAICIVTGEKVKEGEVVELTAKLANHFNKHHKLDPYIEPEGEGEGDDD